MNIRELENNVLFVSFIIVLLLIISGKLHLSDSTLVIAFFGIIATFVVIGNYAQIKDIRNDTIDAINQFKNEVSEKVNGINKKILNEDDPKSIIRQHNLLISEIFDKRGDSKLVPLSKLVQKHENSNVWFRKFVESQSNNDKKVNAIMFSILQLETSTQNTLLVNLLRSGMYKCKVTIANANVAIAATAKWDDIDGVVFVDGNNQPIENISHVSNKQFNKAEIDNILSNLKSIPQPIDA